VNLGLTDGQYFSFFCICSENQQDSTFITGKIMLKGSCWLCLLP